MREEYWFIVNYVSIKRLWGGEFYLVLLLGAGFELLGRVAALAILLEAGEQLALADRLQIQIPVVVLASGNVFRVFAVAGAVSITDLEHGTNGATVLAGDSLQADVVFTAVFRVGVTAEGASVGHLTGSGASETVRYFFVLALGDLVSPHAHTGFSVVSEPRAALVAGSLSVPAVPENVAFGLIREDTVQPLAVRG